MTIIYMTPILQEKTSRGLDKFWQGQVLTDGAVYYTRSRAYQTKADGTFSKEVLSTPVLIQPKNVGRSNESSPKDQAIAEITSDEARKRKKGYVAEGESKTTLPLPMLAHSYEKRKHTITYPVVCNPKLDGLRGFMNADKGFWSRNGDQFIGECVQHLRFDVGDIILDGELILPPDAGGFQDTMRAVKKFRPELSPRLEFHVFDMVDEESGYRERHAQLEKLLEGAPPNIKLVPAQVCHTELEIIELLHRYLSEGHEGVMIRSLEGGYELGKRSNSLLKHKLFIQDSEYPIVDVLEGKGSEEGCAIFVCITPEGKPFNVRPKGDVASRREAFANRVGLIGRSLSVKYQNLSNDNVPRFPVGIGVRDRTLQG